MTAIIIFLLWLGCAYVAGEIGKARGRDGFGWGCLGFVLGPLGVLIAYLMPTDAAAKETAEIAAGTHRRCPQCAELVRVDAVKCRYCGTEMTVYRDSPLAEKLRPK